MTSKYGTILDTPEGKSLYYRWCNLRKARFSREFDTFPAFYEWAMSSGYTEGATLTRRNFAEPYSPDNCQWVRQTEARKTYGDEAREMMAKWNTTVNRLRRYFGLEPLPETREAGI